MKNLFKAYAKAQGEFPAIPKDGTNPHFKSKYSTLDSVISKTRPVLSQNGLGFYQVVENGEGGLIGVETVIFHESGEELRFPAFFVKPSKPDAQGAGSALTYAKRYSLVSALGVSADADDDGNGASVAVERPQKPKKATGDQLTRFHGAIKDKGLAEFLSKEELDTSKATGDDLKLLFKLAEDRKARSEKEEPTTEEEGVA